MHNMVVVGFWRESCKKLLSYAYYDHLKTLGLLKLINNELFSTHGLLHALRKFFYNGCSLNYHCTIGLTCIFKRLENCFTLAILLLQHKTPNLANW